MIDLKYLKENKTAAAFERVYKKLLLPLLIFELVLGAIGIIVSVFGKNGFLLTLVSISFLVIPFVTLFSFFFVQNITNKKKKALEKELFDSKILSDDILNNGKENGIDLYRIALRARCFHELGWIHVPEWCEKDRIMPTEKDSESK